MKFRTASLNQSGKSIELEGDINVENNINVSFKPLGSGQEYMDARTIHDKFCKFDIPYNAGESIKTIRLITKTCKLAILKFADLPFKLNNLRWFLTPKGKMFLKNQEKEFELQKMRDSLNLNQISLG